MGVSLVLKFAYTILDLPLLEFLARTASCCRAIAAHPEDCCAAVPVVVGGKERTVDGLEEVAADGLAVWVKRPEEERRFAIEADWAMAPTARVTWSNALMEAILVFYYQARKYEIVNSE